MLTPPYDLKTYIYNLRCEIFQNSKTKQNLLLAKEITKKIVLIRKLVFLNKILNFATIKQLIVIMNTLYVHMPYYTRR